MALCSVGADKRRNFKDAGRVCPVDYHLDRALFEAKPALSAEVLYVVGGLYGNPFALDAIDAMVKAERACEHDVCVVLNGDTHWFDKTADNFLNIEARMKPYIALVGNVEAELRRQTDIGVGCGCAYPDCDSDAAVSRSNHMHKMLSEACEKYPQCKELLKGRPATMTVEVSGAKVGITHGDEKLIGGWDCSRTSLEDPLRQDELSAFMRDCGIRVFATTHTCAAVALALEDGLMINNGAAGLPNFKGQHFGLITRIAAVPAKEALYSACIDGVWVQAVPVRYDHKAYVKWFDALWPRLSAGAVSYRDRVVSGPDDRIADAIALGGFTVEQAFASEAKSVRFPQADKDDLDEALAELMYFEDTLDKNDLVSVDDPKIMQVNITKRCNMACRHCHVEAGPNRSETMSRQTMEQVIEVMRTRDMETLDITGGAPEMNPDFEWLITEASECGFHVMVRSNLTILREAGYTQLPKRYATLGIEVVASLPSLNMAQTDAQRGRNTFDPSIEVLQQLNALGYGTDPALVLDLVFNPASAILAPKQDKLEAIYRRRLKDEHGITFNRLFAVANCPIGRYGLDLVRTDRFGDYMDLLQDNFNSDAAHEMMCRKQISVGFDGCIYDCDFNQALGLVQMHDGKKLTIADYAATSSIPLKRTIIYRNHCYACAAGQGSSCTGTLVQEQ